MSRLKIKKEVILISVFYLVVAGLLYYWLALSDTVVNDGLMVYGSQSNSGMTYAATYTPSTVGPAYAATDTSPGSAIQFIKIVSSPTRQEKFAAHQKADGQLDVLTCTTGCDDDGDWTVRGTYSNLTNEIRARAFDIAYEQLSGRAIVVFASSASPDKLYYCLWDGSSWEPASECGSTFTPGTGNEIDFGEGNLGAPRWVQIVPYGDRLTDNRSDDILLVAYGLPNVSTSSVSGARWGGSSWSNMTWFGQMVVLSPPPNFMGVAWESNSYQGLAVYEAYSITSYRIYTPGSGWGSAVNGPNTGDYHNWIELASDPMSDRISMIIGDSGDDANVYMWKGDGSTAGFTGTGEVDKAIEQTTGKDVATAWSRFNSNAIFSYTNDRALTQDVVCYTPNTFGSVSAGVGGSGSDDVDNVIYIGSPNSAEVFYMKGDILDDLSGGTWDGAGCTSGDFTDISAGTPWATDLSVTNDNSPPIEYWFSYTLYSAWSRNWRFYDDEASANPSSGLNGVGENATSTVVLDDVIRLRMQFVEKSGGAQTDTRKKLQYTSGCNPNISETACTWVDVGDVTETSAVWRYAASSESCTACNDNTAITAGLTGSTQNGTYITTNVSTSTFYFDGSDAAADDPDNVWTGETNLDDGSTGTLASTPTGGNTAANYIKIEGTNAPTPGTTITAIKARLYGGEGNNGSTFPAVAEIYTDGGVDTGSLLGTATRTGVSLSWSSFVTLSVPTGGWTWGKVQALEVYVYQDGGPATLNICRVGKIELEITTSESNMDHNALAIVEYDYPIKAENTVADTVYYFRTWDNWQQSRVYRYQASSSTECLGTDCTYPNVTGASANVPTVSTPILDEGTSISLTANATKTIAATTTISDDDGWDNITTVTAAFYNSTTTVSGCTYNDLDDNLCYPTTTVSCDWIYATTDTSRDASCTADFWFNAVPTDTGDWSTTFGYETTTWEVWMQGTDASDNTDSATSAQELITTVGLDVPEVGIDYGMVSANATSDTGISVTVNTTGNVPINALISGEDMASGTEATISIDQQKFATTSDTGWEDLDYTATDTPAFELNLDSGRTEASSTLASDVIFWGIKIPSGQSDSYYFGTNTIAATEDQTDW